MSRFAPKGQAEYYICPREGQHARIIAEAEEASRRVAQRRMAEGGKKTGEANKGKKRPGAEKNLGKHGRKR